MRFSFPKEKNNKNTTWSVLKISFSNLHGEGSRLILVGLHCKSLSYVSVLSTTFFIMRASIPVFIEYFGVIQYLFMFILLSWQKPIWKLFIHLILKSRKIYWGYSSALTMDYFRFLFFLIMKIISILDWVPIFSIGQFESVATLRVVSGITFDQLQNELHNSQGFR